MSNQLAISPNSEQFPKFYIYKITFASGRTYVGQHTQRKSNDTYITSSVYFKKYGNNDPIVSRDILIYVKDFETLNIMETICILMDKASNTNNVNGNLGGWVIKFNPTPCPDWKKQYLSELYKNRYFSPETRKKISDKAKGRPAHNKGKKTGKPSWNSGKKGLFHWTDEQKLKMSKKRKGIKRGSMSDDTKRKVGIASSNAYKTSDKKRQALNHKGQHVYNNGTKQIVADVCPDGYVEGRLISKVQLSPKVCNDNPGNKPVRCIETGIIFQNCSCIGIQHVGDAANGKRKTAGGYHWEWVTQSE